MGKVHRHIPSRGAGPLAKAPQDRATAQAYQLRSAKKYVEAKPLFKKLYEAAPQDFALALDYGEICMETEDFTAAVHVYAKILEAEPKHLMALTNLGGALIRAGKLDDARAMLEYALELDPKNIHARINLGGILQAAGDRKGNLDNALEAVSIEPSSSLAFNNLGSAFSDMAMFAEAKHAYETAVMLDPKQVDALVNLAAVEARLGNPASSAEKYEQVLKLLPASAKHRADAVRFYASFEYLKQGILEKGWEYYEGGFSPLVPVNGARSPNRKFSVPRWDGELLNGKTLLVWREQGLGDELLFATCLQELAALGGQIIVECDARLVETFTRSFPDYRVRAEAFLPQAGNISPNNDFDLHVPMGSLMKYFRRDINDFKRSGAYIKPDPVKVAKFAERLAPYKEDYRLVGICWRSGKLDPVRNLSYTTLDEWGEVLKAPSLKFVNLQYGNCEEELRDVEAKYGVEILRWKDLDLKNDLDDVFALMACLDGVCSVQTAVLVMAGVGDIPSVGLRAFGWTLLGQARAPWFKKQKLGNEDVKQTLLAFLDELRIGELWERAWGTSKEEELLHEMIGVGESFAVHSNEWLSHLAMLLAKRGHINDALELVMKLDQLDKELSDLYWRLGWHYYHIGEQSIPLFRRDIARARLSNMGYAKYMFTLASHALKVEVQLTQKSLLEMGRWLAVRGILVTEGHWPRVSRYILDTNREQNS